MTETIAPAVKTPWHLWVVGGVALLWNAMGAADFALTETRQNPFMAEIPAEQRDFIYALPLWAVLAWGLGTWGGFLGSIFLVFRRRFAVKLFGASIVGVVVSALHSYVLSDWMKVSKGGSGAMIFSAVIFVVALLLFVYARAMRARGVLR